MTNNSKCRKNQYIYFRMTKKPKLMLVQKNITPSCWLKKTCVKISICQKHGQPCCENRETSNQLNANKTQRPNKKRNSIQSHSLSTHICYCNKKVNRSLNTSNTCNMQTKNCLIYRRTGVRQYATLRWISSPSYSRSLFYLSTQLKLSHRHRQNPKANIIHTRKPHIWSSNHYRNQPISKSSHQCRHHNKKLHQQTMSSNLYIVKLPISCQNSRTHTPLLHTNNLAHSSCNDTCPPCKHKVHHTNIFCVCTAKPSDILFIPFTGCICHLLLLQETF
jgi:hypothetical protein